jgi:hypothetical protein
MDRKSWINKFNNWRSNYENMSLDQQINFHNVIEKFFPKQQHFIIDNIKEIISLCKNKPKILEFGCWKGELAQAIMSEFDIESWNCIEICTAAIEKTTCTQDSFKYCVPSKFNWFIDNRVIDTNLIIATHFIEHLSDNDFELLARYCKGVDLVYFETPLSEKNRSWHNDFSTHKLNYGWEKVREIMCSQGYYTLKKFQTAELFKYKDSV